MLNSIVNDLKDAYNQLIFESNSDSDEIIDIVAEEETEAEVVEVPEDTGYLQMTAYVDDLGDSFNVVYSAKAGDRASYAEDDDFSGDPDYNYAWIQHEKTWFKHKKGKAKYLSDPYNAHKDEWIRNAANAVRNASSSTRGRAKAKASKVRRKGKR